MLEDEDDTNSDGRNESENNSDASHEPAYMVVDLTNDPSSDSSCNSPSIDFADLSYNMHTLGKCSSFDSTKKSSSRNTSPHETSSTAIDLINHSTSKKRPLDMETSSIKDSSSESSAKSCSTDAPLDEMTQACKKLKYVQHQSISSDASIFNQSMNYLDDDDDNYPDVTNLDDQSSIDLTYNSITTDESFRFIEVDQIFDEINQIVKHIVELTKFPFSISRILISRFKWDIAALTTELYETKNEEFFQKYNVVNPDGALDVSPKNTADECQICFNTTMEGEVSGSLCGHKFCNICWDRYLSTKIMNDGLSETISCPECNIILDNTFVMEKLTDPDIKLTYKRLVANNFIQLKQDYCWCPSPKCNLAIQVLKVDVIAICRCGKRFCHNCFGDWHDPVECKYLKLWMTDDSATLTYLAARTKSCPKCETYIEKNGGCNHMTCRACPHEFCWICLGNWSSHTSCKKYEDDEKIRKEISKSDRLRHFWNRYSEHKISLKYEQELFDEIKANEAKNSQRSLKEVECIQKGFMELLECRRMLMNTYVFVYYLEDDRKQDKVLNKAIFEENQSNLGAATERLSGLLQHYSRESSEESIYQICEKVKADYGYCERRRKELLDHVKEGNEKMIWRYRQ